jgi:subtilase family serine protease
MVGGVGNHTCTCVADPDGVVPELNEGNNSLSVPFTLVP